MTFSICLLSYLTIYVILALVMVIYYTVLALSVEDVLVILALHSVILILLESRNVPFHRQESTDSFSTCKDMLKSTL